MATHASLRAALPTLVLVLLATASLPASAADADVAPPIDLSAGKCDSNLDTNCEYCHGVPRECQHCEVYADYDPIERGCVVNLTATEVFARRMIACVMHPVWCPILTR